MRDAEINLAIARIEFTGKELYPCEDHIDVRLGNGDYTTVDYVNNWQDIGPIIERENISLSPLVDEHPHYGPSFTGEWIAEHILGSNLLTCESYAETPTKAAAMCYLKMKGSE